MNGVLITGGRGFIGRRVVAALAGRGAEVWAPSRSELDVTDNRFPDLPAQTVIHLAARTFVPDSWDSPGAFHAANTQGTVHVLDFCRSRGARLVFVSGYGYGATEALPTAEHEPLRPANPYAFSKASAEAACRFYAEHLGVAALILRPFNVYGPGQPRHFLIPTVIGQALDRDLKAIKLPDTRPRRDFIHVDDVAGAIVMTVDAGLHGTFNIGSGKSHSVSDVVNYVQRAAGTAKPLVDLGQHRQNEILETRADTSAITQACGWRPTLSLADGIAGMVAAEA